jgi:DNA-binding HxlR family transcriptional regulator
MNPAQMKLACYCLRQEYIAPRYMPFEEWERLDTRFEISPTWLRQSLRDLWSLGLLQRDRRGPRPGYAVNPNWNAPPPEETP